MKTIWSTPGAIRSSHHHRCPHRNHIGGSGVRLCYLFRCIRLGVPNAIDGHYRRSSGPVLLNRRFVLGCKLRNKSTPATARPPYTRHILSSFSEPPLWRCMFEYHPCGIRMGGQGQGLGHCTAWRKTNGTHHWAHCVLCVCVRFWVDRIGSASQSYF